VIRPNLPVLGPRFGKRLNEIKSAIAALDPAGVVRSMQAGSVIQLGLNGETIELQPDDVVTSAREREGFAAMAGNGYLVALETDMTEALVREGLAREVVRHMNDWRKTAGFSIDDRISVRYQASGRLKSTLQEYAAYIQQETLASSLQDRVSSGRGFEVEETFGEERLRMEMERTS
jgi:isoleucyl-tRNA synthetase